MKNAIYRKTPHGVEAVARRDHALSFQLRSLLILVDGHRSVEDLSRLSTAGPQVQQLLEQLQAQGLVEVASVAGSPATTGAVVRDGSATAAPAPSLADARRYAARRLTDLLGPMAEDLCLRIEAARSPQDLIAAVKRAEPVVRGARGADAAAAFMQDMEARRPA